MQASSTAHTPKASLGVAIVCRGIVHAGKTQKHQHTLVHLHSELWMEDAF
jgi:hypothetical protein